MNVQVGRFGNLKIQAVEEGTTIGTAMRLAGFTKAENEVIQDIETDEHSMTDICESGKTYVLVQRVKSGF